MSSETSSSRRCFLQQRAALAALIVLWLLSLLSSLLLFNQGFLCGDGKPPSIMQPSSYFSSYFSASDESAECNYGTVDLVPLRKTWDYDRGFQEDKVFLLETSGRPRLNPRQACSIESALAKSGLGSVIVMMWSPFVDLADPTTCRLYRLGSRGRLHFHRIDLEMDFKDTPLYDVFKNGTLLNSKHVATHMSDALRLAYLFKFGGWYADLDFVFVRPLKGLKNVLASTEAKANVTEFHLTNGILNLEKRHLLLREYLKEFVTKFKGIGRAEVGPMTLTRTVRGTCQRRLKPGELLYNISKPNRCLGVTAMEPDVFHPFRPFEMKELWPLEKKETRTASDWEKKTKKALAVHFFSFMTKGRKVNRNETLDAYSYFAPKYCPISYSSPDF